MRQQLLVSPARLEQHGQTQRLLNRVIPAMLRLAVAISRKIFRGRGVSFACEAVARLLGNAGQVWFQLGSGGTLAVAINDHYWLKHLMLDGSYELDIDHFLKRTLKSRDAFLDCGANLGLWSIVAANVIRDPTRVVAVEAASRTFARLKGNWEANDRSFTLLHRALSDVTGEEVSFFASASDHASATLVATSAPGDAHAEYITTVSLLDLLAAQTTLAEVDSLIFAKLDIEGVELAVLATIDPELHGRLILLYEDHGSGGAQLAEFLLERGFRVAFIAEDDRLEHVQISQLHRLAQLKQNPARGYNFLACAPKGAAAMRLSELYPDIEW